MYGDEDGERQSSALAGLAMALVIVVVCLVLVRKLQVRSMLESCAASQQTGCMIAIDRLRVSHLLAGL